MPIIADGTREPLYCVPMGTGHAQFFGTIAENFRQGRPVYGFQDRGRTAKVRPFLSIRDMAANYVQELRAFQPQGPYHLAGFCSGAVVAQEMARILTESGEDVPTLVMAGPSGDYPEMDPGLGLTELVEFQLGTVRNKLGRDLTDLDSVVRDLAELRWFEDGLPAADFYRRMVLFAGALFAQEHHTPQHYAGPAVVCMYAHEDVRSYWAPLLPAATIMQVAAITTLDLLREPALAAEFSRLLA
ncbi:thioesterase domain-containing protein [Fodinicola feengrottensis]|uniref:thioesterase domain-containing protein n=1 Tax=Fodinicola feengrottensis TaxID=435914 RepID=UPI0013CF816D|nr:thioesterase domain-containing protein [Fodinicola feengrottensis]